MASAKASEPEPASDSAKDATVSRRELRQVAALLILVAPADDDVVRDGVLHVDDDGCRGIDACQRLHRQHGLEEIAALAAKFFGNLDSHEAELEHLAQ